MLGKDLGFTYGFFYHLPVWITYWGLFLLPTLVASRAINYICRYIKGWFGIRDSDWPIFNNVNFFSSQYAKVLKSELVTLIFSSMLVLDIVAFLPQLSIFQNYLFFNKQIDFFFYLLLGLKLHILKGRIGSNWKKYILLIWVSVSLFILDFILARSWVLMTSYLILVEKGSIGVSSDILSIMDTGPMGFISLIVYAIMKFWFWILH